MELKGKNKYLACIKTIAPSSYITLPGQKRKENYTPSQHRMNIYKDNTKNLDANSFIFGKTFINSQLFSSLKEKGTSYCPLL